MFSLGQLEHGMQQARNYSYTARAQIISRSFYEPWRQSGYNFTKPRTRANKEQAAKNHSESEKKRRMRINGQYDMLKQLFPNNHKKDKASLLDATIKTVKILTNDCSTKEEGTSSNRQMNEASNQKRMKEASIQKEMEKANNAKNEMKKASNPNDVGFPSWENKWNLKHEEGLMKATLNCDDQPGLISKIAKALGSVEAKVVKAEMVTVGGRTRIMFWVKGSKGEKKAEEVLKNTLIALTYRPNPTKKRRT